MTLSGSRTHLRIPPSRAAQERLTLLLLVLALPACTTTPPAPYDCAAPPSLRGVVKVKDPIPNRYIVVMKARPGAVSDAQRLAARFTQLRNVGTFSHALSGFAATIDASTARQLSQQPEVAYVQGRAGSASCRRASAGASRPR
jgi:hypothetical protein